MKKPAAPLAEVEGGGGGGINPPPAPPKAPAPGKKVGGKDYADEKTPKAKRGFNYSVGSVPIPLCPLGWSDFWKDKIWTLAMLCQVVLELQFQNFTF